MVKFIHSNKKMICYYFERQTIIFFFHFPDLRKFSNLKRSPKSIHKNAFKFKALELQIDWKVDGPFFFF